MKFQLGPGKMLYLPPKISHHFNSSSHQGERLIALIQNQAWQNKVNVSFSPTILPLSQLAKELFFYLLLNPKTIHHKSITGLLIETLSESLELMSRPGQVGEIEHIESRVQDFRVMSALEFMKTNLRREISMSEVAKKAGLSLRSLNRLILEETGLSPRHALIQYRISKAKELFLSGKTNVTEVALDVGYHSLSQFIAMFRCSTGQLPSEFARMASFQKK